MDKGNLHKFKDKNNLMKYKAKPLIQKSNHSKNKFRKQNNW